MVSGSGDAGGVLYADFPKLPLPQNRLNQLVESSTDWAHAHGLVMRTKEHKDKSDVCQTTPITLLPTPFPRKLFEQALRVQNLIATLYHDIAYDFDFLIDCHKDVITTDSFTKGLIDILKQVRDEGLAQRKTLAIQRSDYMCHKDPFSCEYTLKQIEVNNIAASMGAHAERVSKLHRRTMFELGYDKETIEKAIPKNEPVKLISEAIYKAWELYSCRDALVLVVVEEENQNQIDQRHVEYGLEGLGIPVDQIVRKTLAECSYWCSKIPTLLRTLSKGAVRPVDHVHDIGVKPLCLTLSPERHLMFCGSRVAVVYFRSGYTPDQYPTEKGMKETVHLIWSPNISINSFKLDEITSVGRPTFDREVGCYKIALDRSTGSKYEEDTADGVIERFVGHPRNAAAIRATFAGLWSINGDDPVTQKLIKNAIAHPSRFVLKPQLEGGGGNFYGEKMAEKLKSMEKDELGAFILMERTQPLVVENYLLRAMQPAQLANVVSELGVYGYALGDRGMAEVRQGGHLLRTKSEEVDEGGVAVGAAVIDSPFLYELL